MAEIGSAFISVMPSARGFGTSLSRQVSPQMSRAGVSAGAGFGKSLLKGFLAIGAGVKIAQFFGDSLAEAREANAVAALTANVIKTTGGVAKVSAAQVGRLADALSRKTGIDDEQIATSENLLLTFKKVQRAGEGVRNIFARATRASVDLSASGFGAMSSTAKMLGKALNDPVKGLTALGRAGVTFTQGQIDQVKALVESGRQFRAQNLILREVESQVKGAAEAQVTNSDKARVALANLKETIGQSLVPATDALAGVFANRIAPAITGFVSGLQNGTGAGGRLAGFIQTSVMPVLRGLGDFVTHTVLPAFRDALPKVLVGARDAFNKVRRAVADNKPELQQLLGAAKHIAEVFYTRVVPAVYALAGQALKNLGTALSITIRVVGAAVRAMNSIYNAFKTVGAGIAVAVLAFTNFATAVRQKVANAVATVKALPSRIKSALGNLGSLLYSAGQAIIQGLINGVTSKIGALTSQLHHLTSLIPKHKGPPSKDKVLLYGSGQLIMDGLINGITSREKPLTDALDKVGKKVKDRISKLRDSLQQAKSDFASLVEPIASNFTQGLFDFTNAGAFTTNLTTVKGTLTTLLANFAKLRDEGLSPGFLYQLFQSGGPGLINSLAGLDKASALSAGNLFGDVMSLSDQLGTAVAGATDKGAALENQTERLERKLDKLINATQRVGREVGSEVNGSASAGHRRSKHHSGQR